MPSSQKREEKPAESITPMLSQTEQLVRQNLIARGYTPGQASLAMLQASRSLKGQDVTVPPAIRGAFNEARDMLYFIPKLMKKGYTAEESFSMVDAARNPIDMTFFSSNRIEDYDVSTLKERFDYMKSHKKEDYRAVMGGLMFKGPAKVPAVREKTQEPPKTEVAKAEGPVNFRLAMVPRKVNPTSIPIEELDRMLLREKPTTDKKPEAPAEVASAAEEQKPAKKKGAKSSMEYAYNIDIYGQNYTVTINRELKGKDPKSQMLDILQKEPKAIVSIISPGGEVFKASSGKGFDKYAAYLASEYNSLIDGVKISGGLPSAGKVEKVAREYAYNIDIRGQNYVVTLNRELKGDDLKAELLDTLQNKPRAVASIKAPGGEKITTTSRVGLDKYLDYLVSEYRSFMKELKVESA